MAEPWQLPPPRDREVPPDELAAVEARMHAAFEGRRAARWGTGRRPLFAAAALAAALAALGLAIVVGVWPGPKELASDIGDAADTQLVFVTDDEAAEVRGVGRASIEMAAESRVELEEALPERVVYRVRRGSAVFRVERQTARRFVVKVEDIEVHVVGTVFRVKAGGAGGPVSVEVLEGVVELVTPTGVHRLDAGHTHEEKPLDEVDEVDEVHAADAAHEVHAADEVDKVHEVDEVHAADEVDEIDERHAADAAHEVGEVPPIDPAPTGAASVVAPPAKTTAVPRAPRPAEPRSARPERAAAPGAPAPKPDAEQEVDDATSPITVEETPSAEALLLGANQARVDQDVDEAIRLYRDLRRRHPRDPLVPIAAYAEGRLLADARREPRAALEVWEIARAKGPPKSIEENLLGRLVLTYSQVGDRVRCVERRAEYLRRFPQGIHADRVQDACAR